MAPGSTIETELQDALAKLLGGYLPICAECKEIRDEDGSWSKIDVYIQNHTDAKFTYGICPECKERLYPELYEDRARSGPFTNKVEKHTATGRIKAQHR